VRVVVMGMVVALMPVGMMIVIAAGMIMGMVIMGVGRVVAGLSVRMPVLVVMIAAGVMVMVIVMVGVRMVGMVVGVVMGMRGARLILAVSMAVPMRLGVAVTMVVTAAAGLGRLGRGDRRDRACPAEQRRAEAELADALLDLLAAGRLAGEGEGQPLARYRDRDVADAGQVLEGLAQCRRATAAIHALDLPGQGLAGLGSGDRGRRHGGLLMLSGRR
jgi:hypothetical protein